MSRTPSTVRLALVTVIAGSLLVTGVLFARRPELVHGAIPEVIAVVEALDPGHALVAVLVVLLVLAPIQGFSNRMHAEPPRSLESLASVDDPSASTVPPEGLRRQLGALGDDPPTPVIGADLESAVERATDYDGASRKDRGAARDVLVEALRPIAAAVYARQTGVDEDRALEDVEAGVWTDDPRAGAFLATEEGRSTPLTVWLFDLLTAADPFQRGLSRTIETIETMRADPGVSVE